MQGALAAQALPTGTAPPETPESVVINSYAITVYDAGSFVSYHMACSSANTWLNAADFEVY